MQINKANVDNAPSANRIPGLGQPGLLNEAINQDMEVRFAILMEFQNSNVLGHDAILSLEVSSKFIEGLAKVWNGIALDFVGIECEG